MSCAPFESPLDNALSYLYTNKVIDADLNVKSKKAPMYLEMLNKQAGEPLFTVSNGKLYPIQEAFNRLSGDAVKTYQQKMKDARKFAVEIWNNSDKKLPATFTQEEQDYLNDLFDKGVLELNCTL